MIAFTSIGEFLQKNQTILIFTHVTFRLNYYYSMRAVATSTVVELSFIEWKGGEFLLNLTALSL